MATFEGYKVKSGVRWKITKDTCIIKSYPKKSGVTYKLYKKSWKNYCPACKKHGTLQGFGHGKGEWGVEGGLRCKKCDADYCGVTGKDTGTSAKAKKRKLTKAPTTSTAKSSATDNSDLQDILSKIADEYLQNRNPVKSVGKLILSPLYEINPCDYLQLAPPLFSSSDELVAGSGSGVVKFVSACTITAEGNEVTIVDEVPEPADAYKPVTARPNSNNVSESAVLNTKGLKPYQKKLRKLGAELKTFKNIYNYFKTRDGKGGYIYSFYYEHYNKAADIYAYDESSAKYNMTKKLANCVDYSWLIFEACMGARIKGVNIIHGTATFSSGKTYGHFWNTYNGKIYDASTKSGHNYRKKKVVISSTTQLKKGK